MSARARWAPFEPPRWERDGADWPNRAHSRFVVAGGIRWHVQVLGSGPPLLVLHGAGAASHSFRDVAPRLAQTFQVVVPDLPGHGFTGVGAIPQLGLPGMARSVGSLLDALAIRAPVAVAHSAGAAILCRMALDRLLAPPLIVAFNPALFPFGGLAGWVWSPVAKLATRNPLAPRMMAWGAADRRRVERTLVSTGSRVDARGIELYHRLARRPGHVAGTVAMMAEWDLEPLVRDLPRLDVPVTMVVGDGDRAIPPQDARRAAALLRNAEILTMRGVGHLAHEERPEEAARIVAHEVSRRGIASPG